jgi:hypothetical protein
MPRLSTLAFASLLTFTAAQAQTSDIVVFSEMGEKFTLIIDGDVKNEAPATRVVATGLRNETPSIVVKFAEAGIPPVKQNGWIEHGKEYTLKVTTNKKGEYVLRMQGQAELGTAKASPIGTSTSTEFVEDAPSEPAPGGQGATGSSQTTTTTTQTTGTSENVNMNVGVNGVGINMSMGFTEPDMESSTTTTTTTTHTSSTTTSGTATSEPVVPPAPVEEPVYRMPGYSGPIGCAMPMNDGEFSEAKASIESKGFEESKMTLARQIGDSHCFSTIQVTGIMGLFGFEETKLEFAKYAYDHTHDIGNYYKVNDAFSFESSIDELNKYIKGR